MTRINTFLILCGIIVAIILFASLATPLSRPESYRHGDGVLPPDPSLGLTYLNQYERQDWYRNNPSIWPVSSIPPTVRFEILRGRST